METNVNNERRHILDMLTTKPMSLEEIDTNLTLGYQMLKNILTGLRIDGQVIFENDQYSLAPSR